MLRVPARWCDDCLDGQAMRALIVAGVVAGCGGGGGGTAVDAQGFDVAVVADGSLPQPDGSVDATPPPWPSCTGCECTSTGMVPLPELGRGTYMGAEGGLYPGGENARPAAHETIGLAEAVAIVPRDAAGNPDPNGEYVLLSIGMSNTTQEFSAFVPLANGDAERDSHLVVVDGAQGGQTAGVWADPTSMPWTVVDMRLANANVTREQVAVAWVKVADPGPSGAFDPFVDTLADEMRAIVRNLKARFPNIRMVYLSSRIYAGYATGVSPLNPEPFAYASGFAVKRLIADQIAGDPELALDQAPWLSWGPYLWADGTTPRDGDGLTWECSDLGMDGTHPATAGRQKVADLLYDFFRTDSTAREWYLTAP
jgi:hypothetical protein